MEDDRAAVLHRAMRAAGFKRDRSVVQQHRFIGKLQAAGRTLSVAITFADAEFLQLPNLHVVPPTDLGDAVAHVEEEGKVCYAQSGLLVLDRYDVAGSVAICLELARRGLERIVSHRNIIGEVEAEFPQHWWGDIVYVDLRQNSSQAAALYKIPASGGALRVLLADSDSALKPFALNESDLREVKQTARKAKIVRCRSLLTFKRGQRQPNTLAELVQWGDAVEPGLGEGLLSAAADLHRADQPVLCIRGANGTVGAILEIPVDLKIAATRPQAFAKFLRRDAARISLTRLSGIRVDPEFIVTRNLNGGRGLAGKRIVVVGCGTIGGHLAKFLAHSGGGYDGGSLTLIDNQLLAPGNIGRHLLGVMHVGQNKAEACREELLRLFPDSTILPITGDAVRMLGHLSGADLVIDATGEEALSATLNDTFVKARVSGRSAPCAIHIWLFGNGAAAQGILTGTVDTACYKCLRPNLREPWRFDPILHKQQLIVAPAACGEAPFLPYSIAAPAMAAALAAQMAMDWASGRPRPTLRTIRIDHAVTRQIKDQSPHRSERCPACALHS